MNTYAEMKKRHQEEVNALPIYWAFTEERFDEVLKELGLTKNDTDKLCNTFGGGFCLAKDAQMIADTLARNFKEVEDAIQADETGDGFIKDMFLYELRDHEYGPAPDFSDATLSNVTRDILQKYSPETLENVRLKDDLELSCATSEWLFDGIDTIEGVVALLYTMAWAFAETRERLRMYEETRLSPLDLKDRLIAPFQNDMFAMVWGAFKKLYPDKECEIYWEPQIRDEEDGKPVYGLTDFADDGSVAVFVKPSLEVADAVEILAHELAHVAVGIEYDHDEVWQEAFDKIFEEYNRIGNQMFPNGEQCVMDDHDEK